MTRDNSSVVIFQNSITINKPAEVNNNLSLQPIDNNNCIQLSTHQSNVLVEDLMNVNSSRRGRNDDDNSELSTSTSTQQQQVENTTTTQLAPSSLVELYSSCTSISNHQQTHQSILLDHHQSFYEKKSSTIVEPLIANHNNNVSEEEEDEDDGVELKNYSSIMKFSTLQMEMAEKGQVVKCIHCPSASHDDSIIKRDFVQTCCCNKCFLPSGCSILVLCVCWSAIILFTLFIVISFGYYAHMPIDSNGSCSTLYYSNENVFFGTVERSRMDSIDLNRERKFFSSIDFYNASTTSHHSDNLPMNYYNTLMTHNSYHKKGMMSSIIPSLNYEHDSLTNQLNGNVRGLELDIHLNRRTNRFQVYHIPFIDDRSNCDCFLSCLLEIKNWITANTRQDSKPDLITIFIEPKYAKDYISFCRRNDIDTLPNMMNEILRVFPSDQILTPAKLKGDYSTLRGSVHGRGWPLKNSVKGMVLFVLNLWDENNDCKYLLKNEKPLHSNNVTSMDLIFYREYWNNMASSKSDSVFFEVNDARVFMNMSEIEPMLVSTGLVDQNTLFVDDPSYIIPSPVSKASQHGYMIRCTAGGVTELRARISMSKRKESNPKLKHLSKTEACLRSGAQLLNTDYPYADLFSSLFTSPTFQNPLFFSTGTNNNNNYS